VLEFSSNRLPKAASKSTLLGRINQQENQFWALYCELANIPPFDSPMNQSETEKKITLRKFCEMITDYTTAWSLRLAADATEIAECCAQRFPQVLEETTELQHMVNMAIHDAANGVLDFQAKYLTEEASLKNLHPDLNRVGEQLATLGQLQETLNHIVKQAVAMQTKAKPLSKLRHSASRPRF